MDAFDAYLGQNYAPYASESDNDSDNSEYLMVDTYDILGESDSDENPYDDVADAEVSAPSSPRKRSESRPAFPLARSMKSDVVDQEMVLDWNEDFQSLLRLPDSFSKYRELSSLYRDFIYAAKTYGRIIISEKYLPEDKRTIKAFNPGGLAGGIKYKVDTL